MEAAEKFRKACIYQVNGAAAAKLEITSLTLLCQELNLHTNHVLEMAQQLEDKYGDIDSMQYPDSSGCPCHRYGEEDVMFVMEKVQVAVPAVQMVATPAPTQVSPAPTPTLVHAQVQPEQVTVTLGIAPNKPIKKVKKPPPENQERNFHCEQCRPRKYPRQDGEEPPWKKPKKRKNKIMAAPTDRVSRSTTRAIRSAQLKEEMKQEGQDAAETEQILNCTDSNNENSAVDEAVGINLGDISHLKTDGLSEEQMSQLPIVPMVQVMLENLEQHTEGLDDSHSSSLDGLHHTDGDSEHQLGVIDLSGQHVHHHTLDLPTSPHHHLSSVTTHHTPTTTTTTSHHHYHTPAHHQTTIVSAHHQVATVSAHQQMAAAPAHQQVVTVPAHQQAATVSVHQQVTTVPAHQQVATIPAHHQVTTIPAHQPTKSAVPVHQHITTIPAHQQTTTLSAHQQLGNVSCQQQSVVSPAHQASTPGHTSHLPLVTAHLHPSTPSHNQLPLVSTHKQLVNNHQSPTVSAHQQQHLPAVTAHQQSVTLHQQLPVVTAHQQAMSTPQQLAVVSAHQLMPAITAHQQLVSVAAHQQSPAITAHQQLHAIPGHHQILNGQHQLPAMNAHQPLSGVTIQQTNDGQQQVVVVSAEHQDSGMNPQQVSGMNSDQEGVNDQQQYGNQTRHLALALVSIDKDDVEDVSGRSELVYGTAGGTGQPYVVDLSNPALSTPHQSLSSNTSTSPYNHP
ncbi:hypothetical protein Pmani_026232 [Petrolisthes manimaculis]|uniref:Uncharacterized protein n=1 Tax=Petrolisthes manimaculis TaxID=1843537 RepID=A0AAE1P530_9EUCA|nr:hypothetical protein Pmani_026232 [Petrolisthes manimaculis]